jgi:5-enolpyruvylshikimate-3-phosphate synthase
LLKKMFREIDHKLHIDWLLRTTFNSNQMETLFLLATITKTFHRKMFNNLRFYKIITITKRMMDVLVIRMDNNNNKLCPVVKISSTKFSNSKLMEYSRKI